MLTANESFGSTKPKYYRASEFDREIVLTIKSIERIEFTNEGVTKPKPVLFFEENAQGLVLNKSNWTALALMLGDDTDDWIGAKIALAPATTDFKGSSVRTIKVKRAPQPKAAHAFNDDVGF